jgi:hypothetical protein
MRDLIAGGRKIVAEAALSATRREGDRFDPIDVPPIAAMCARFIQGSP